MVMDYIPGDNLQVKLNAQGAMSESEVLPIMDQVLDALTYTHGQKPPVIHRDIKPANIVVRKDGMAFLVDFGIAKIDRTLTGAKAYTPHFAPPEQHGTGTDPRSDVYSLGATLYALLTGQAPTESIERVQGTSLTSPRQIKPSISSATEKIILKAMSLKPEDRYQTAQEFRSALMGTLPAAGVQPQPISVKPPAAKPVAVAVPKPQPKVTANKDIIVAADGSGQFRTIVEGCMAATNGGTVLVKPGTYREVFTVTGNISIRGEGDRSKIILEVTGKDIPGIRVKSGKLTIEGITIKAASQNTGCVEFVGGSGTLMDCDISGGSLSVVRISDTAVAIHRCLIHGGAEVGVYLGGDSGGALVDCDIFGNKTGIACFGTSHPMISGCRIHENQSSGINCKAKSHATIEKSIVSGHDIGIVFSDETTSTAQSCQVTTNSDIGIACTDTSKPQIENCEIFENGTGLLCVKHAQPAVNNCQIFGNKTSGITFSDQSSGTIRDTKVFKNLQGIDIHRNASPSLTKTELFENKSGIFAKDESRAKFTVCKILRNGDGGVSLWGKTQTIFESCTITENKGFGIKCEESSSPTFTDCLSAGNEGKNFSKALLTARPKVVRCHFE
jgi:nitrous oxidase accessory protein NosD